MTEFKIRTEKITLSESFAEASADELRVLLALMCDKNVSTEEELAAAAKVSRARTHSALALWRAEGIILEGCADPCQENATITEEFESRIEAGEIPEIAAVDVARSLRDSSLTELMELIADMLGEAALPRESVKRITALVTELALSPEYILTLASFMKEGARLTVTRLVGEADRLVRRGIDNVEALEAYIKDELSSTAAEKELRRVFGIYDRAVTPTMKKYFKAWTEELGYGTEIIAAAYDISATSTGKIAAAHINKILEGWHEAGCTTISDCMAEAEKRRAASAEKFGARSPRARQKSEAPKPKFGNFDINDAFQKALERSYGKDD